jgi:hypothetical protein
VWVAEHQVQTRCGGGASGRHPQAPPDPAAIVS